MHKMRLLALMWPFMVLGELMEGARFVGWRLLARRHRFNEMAPVADWRAFCRGWQQEMRWRSRVDAR